MTRSLVAAAVIVAALTAPAAAQACEPTPVDLGTLGGNNGQVVAVKPWGLATGTAQDSAGQRRAVMWSNGAIRNLHAPPDSQALDANRAGAVVIAVGPGDMPVSYLHRNGVLSRLPGLPGFDGYTRARRINARGEVAGHALDADGGLRPVIWVSGQIRDLGIPAGFVDGVALGINDRGEVVGNLGRADGSLAPFRWHRGSYTILPTLGGQSGSPFVIDNRSVAAGWADTSDGPTEAAVWDRDGAHGLGFLRDGDLSQVLGTDGAGAYAGASNLSTGGDSFRGFAVRAGEPMVELPPLGTATPGAFSIAHGVDRTGDAAGASTDALGRNRPTLWRCALQTTPSLRLRVQRAAPLQASTVHADRNANAD